MPTCNVGGFQCDGYQMVSEIVECFRCGHGKDKHMLKEASGASGSMQSVQVAGMHKIIAIISYCFFVTIWV